LRRVGRTVTGVGGGKKKGDLRGKGIREKKNPQHEEGSKGKGKI